MDNSSTRKPQITLDELVGFLELSTRSAVQACSGFRYDFYNPRDRFAVLLLYGVLDYGRSLIALAKAGTYAGIPVIARSMLEAYADIANLCDDPGYWRYVLAADAAQWKQLLERAKAGDNPVLQTLSRDALLPVGLSQYSNELKQLEADGVKPMKIWKRFQCAGLTHEYESAYALLSHETHSNISGLQGHYVDWDDGRAWVVPPGELSRHTHHYELPGTLTAAEIVLKSTEKVLRLFGHGVAVLSEANRELGRIWTRAKAEDAADVATG